MGRLSDTFLPSREVPIPHGKGASITIRGVSADDISQLYFRHKGAIERLYAGFIKGEEPPSMETVVGTVLAEAPDLAASVIAHANGEPENTEDAKGLPIIVQTRALLDILDLSFDSMAEVKKILVDLAFRMNEANQTFLRDTPLTDEEVEQLKSLLPSEPGSGASESS